MAKIVKPITSRTVVDLYDLTEVTSLVGIEDYTEGVYNGDPSTCPEVAQKNQHNYLLDELGARKGFRLLDVGCGLGTLLVAARERGVKGVGITISEGQKATCLSKGLNVHLLNYKNLPHKWDGRFDGIIANGSLEHFCQPEDAIKGKQDQIYTDMFGIFARLLDPDSYSQKVVTTAIHFRDEAMDPRKLLRNPLLQLFDIEGFHASILNRGYGGYYPIKGQLEDCAKGFFRRVKEVDGTEDYRLTADYWVREYGRALFTNPKFIKAMSIYFLKRPLHTFYTTLSYVGLQSWAWQFRGKHPPTILYRHTWQKS